MRLCIFFLCISVVLVSACCLAVTGKAANLTISSSANITGQGHMDLSYTGELLNVSIWQNSHGWNITAEGRA